MLPQPHRLRRAGEIRQLREQGRAWRHPLAILLVLARHNDPLEDEYVTTRFAVSASRQVGNAVARNRAKRLLREAIRHHLHEIETGWNC
ncbi:MAG: ribonuclease P protein component, partial [Anaerolineales bacterium]|nr:ribonuclease P protein component [Anaerolineales bacterium]